MTLAAPLAVSFSVAGGSPIDTSDWIAVALDDFVEQRSRGIVVATESVESDGRSLEFARVIKELILSELRAMDDLPPDEALGRAFAAANGMLHDEGQPGSSGGFDRKVLVGATAVLIDGHRCTIGHVPPGQITLIEDGLAYAVPDLLTWLPDYAIENDATSTPEPLGYTSWTAPILAQTELSDGDVVMVCTSALAEAWAVELAETGLRVADLASYYGRSPDRALDVFRGLLISQGIEDGSALALAFPPRPGSFGVVTWGDVGWKLRERRRRIRGHVKRLLPSRVRSGVSTGTLRSPDASDVLELDDDDDHDGTPPHVAGQTGSRSRWTGTSSRFRRRTHGADTWNAPKQSREYGVPRTHGVQLHRSVSADRGGSTWRNQLPRLPFGGAIIGTILVLLVALIGFGVWSVLPRFQETPADTTGLLAQVDQAILAAGDTSDPDGMRQLLDLAQETLDNAAENGAQESAIAPRQAAITEARDVLDNVIRLDGLTRVGSLPVELRGTDTHTQFTQGGVFLVNGSLFQLRAEERQIVRVLGEGETVDNAEVGDLFGIAQDAVGFYVTDGAHVFTLQPDGSWRAVQLGDINDLGAWSPGPTGAFAGSLYILEQEFRNIYRFDTEAEDDVAEPYDWVLASVRPDLANAVDMAVDSSIYVLLDDGEVLTYRLGDLESRQNVPFTEEGEPQSILIGTGTRLLYIAMSDGEDGWIVVFDPESGEAWQLRLPASFSTEDAEVSAPFAGLQDIAIDEASGTVYIVNEDAVWTAQYSLPAEAQPDGTPTPEPAVDGS